MLIYDEPEDVYHGNRGKYLTSHLLADYRKCPLLYHRKVTGAFEEPDRAAYAFGRAAHCYLLEGEEAFASRYVVGGPINEKTGKPYGTTTQAYAAWAMAQTRPVLSEQDFALLHDMASGMSLCPAALDIVLPSGRAEVVVRNDKEMMQTRMDWYDAENCLFVDLKTCSDIQWFEADAKRYGYAYQMAFYAELLKLEVGFMPKVYLLATEKQAPYRCGVWLLDDDLLKSCAAENVAAINRLRQDTAKQEFATGYEEVRRLML